MNYYFSKKLLEVTFIENKKFNSNLFYSINHFFQLSWKYRIALELNVFINNTEKRFLLFRIRENLCFDGKKIDFYLLSLFSPHPRLTNIPRISSMEDFLDLPWFGTEKPLIINARFTVPSITKEEHVFFGSKLTLLAKLYKILNLNNKSSEEYYNQFTKFFPYLKSFKIDLLDPKFFTKNCNILEKYFSIPRITTKSLTWDGFPNLDSSFQKIATSISSVNLKELTISNYLFKRLAYSDEEKEHLLLKPYQEYVNILSESIIKILKNSPNLCFLDLHINYYLFENLRAIFSCFKNLPNLKEIIITPNDISKREIVEDEKSSYMILSQPSPILKNLQISNLKINSNHLQYLRHSKNLKNLFLNISITPDSLDDHLLFNQYLNSLDSLEDARIRVWYKLPADFSKNSELSITKLKTMNNAILEIYADFLNKLNKENKIMGSLYIHFFNTNLTDVTSKIEPLLKQSPQVS